jgi:uncharacterized membrane protein (DUF4010 family)
MAAVLFAFALFRWLRHGAAASVESFNLRNPVELGQAIQFGVFLAVVFLLTKAIHIWLGDIGIYVVAGIAGVADVDALTVSLSRMAGTELAVQVAVLAILLATVVNTVTKAVLVGVFGGFKMANQFTWPVIVTLLLGALVFSTVLS